MNPGKVFEADFKESAKNEEIFILRINDTYTVLNKMGAAQFTPKNPCDYLIFYRGHLFPLELKSTEYKSISMDRESGDDKMIKLSQIQSLSQFSLYEDVEPGFIFNFRGKEGDVPVTYWIPIEDFNDFYSTTDKKSINQIDTVMMKNCIIINQKAKRTHYTYSVKELLDKILERKEGSNAKSI